MMMKMQSATWSQPHQQQLGLGQAALSRGASRSMPRRWTPRHCCIAAALPGDGSGSSSSSSESGSESDGDEERVAVVGDVHGPRGALMTEGAFLRFLSADVAY